MNNELEQLKELVAANLDPIELLDILGMEMVDLVEKLEEEIEDAEPQLRRACR